MKHIPVILSFSLQQFGLFTFYRMPFNIHGSMHETSHLHRDERVIRRLIAVVKRLFSGGNVKNIPWITFSCTQRSGRMSQPVSVEWLSSPVDFMAWTCTIWSFSGKCVGANKKWSYAMSGGDTAEETQESPFSWTWILQPHWKPYTITGTITSAGCHIRPLMPISCH